MQQAAPKTFKDLFVYESVIFIKYRVNHACAKCTRCTVFVNISDILMLAGSKRPSTWQIGLILASYAKYIIYMICVIAIRLKANHCGG